MSSVIDLSKLPAPKVIAEISVDDLLTEMLTELTARMPDLHVTVTDPAYKLLEVVAYWRMLDRANMNDQIRQLLAAYATGSDLDHIAVTYYGTARHDGEADESYRRRMLLAYDSWSTAGSQNSYIYHALGVSSAVRDATAVNQSAGHVLVTVLADEGDGTAPQSLLNDVLSAVNAEWVRPLTDHVEVQSAHILPYQVRGEIVLRDGPSPDVVLAEAIAAVDAYTRARHKLGVNVIRGALEAALYVEGVESATLIEPAMSFICNPEQAAYCTHVQVEAIQ